MKSYFKIVFTIAIFWALFLPTTNAQSLADTSDIFKTQFMEIDLQIKTEAIANSNAKISEFKTEFSYFPQESYRQEILRFDASPQGNVVDNNYVFKLNNPNPNDLSFIIDATFRTENKVHEIQNKIPFPLEKYPSEVFKYTKPSSKIDSDNEDIIRLASTIAAGEDDLYAVVNKVGIWVEENIEYSLDTMTEEAALPASWALKNRRGVCDELTNLFIAQLRSLGIPARFVSGMAYTNSELFADPWNAHGWAEVYFPDVGWVPFDITYGQFSYIDATHIKLSDSIDPDYTRTKFTWLGNNVDVTTTPLEFNTQIQKQYGERTPQIEMKVDLIDDHVGFGSYNLVKVNVKNEEDYYLTTRVTLANADILEVLDRNDKNVMLKPREEKTLYWVIKVDDDLSTGFIYSVPITAYSIFGEESEKELTMDKTGNRLQKHEVEDIKRGSIEETAKTYSKQLDFSCTAKEEFFEDEEIEVYCKIKNTGNLYLENINVCLEECQVFDLGITQERNMTFDATNVTVGENQLNIIAASKEIRKTASTDFFIKDTPKIAIENIIAPKTVEFDERFTVNITLNKESTSIPQKVNLNVKGGVFEKVLTMEKLTLDRTFILEVGEGKLNKGENPLVFTLSYEDERGNTFQTDEQVTITIENVSFLQNMLILVRNTIHSIEGLFT